MLNKAPTVAFPEQYMFPEGRTDGQVISILDRPKIKKPFGRMERFFEQFFSGHEVRRSHHYVLGPVPNLPFPPVIQLPNSVS